MIGIIKQVWCVKKGTLFIDRVKKKKTSIVSMYYPVKKFVTGLNASIIHVYHDFGKYGNLKVILLNLFHSDSHELYAAHI